MFKNANFTKLLAINALSMKIKNEPYERMQSSISIQNCTHLACKQENLQEVEQLCNSPRR